MRSDSSICLLRLEVEDARILSVHCLFTANVTAEHGCARQATSDAVTFARSMNRGDLEKGVDVLHATEFVMTLIAGPGELRLDGCDSSTDDGERRRWNGWPRSRASRP